jgi:hypothetical protein
MSLEVPNLDDRQWADLVEEARSLIPRFAPLWTDHNVHDPGMTFIELFAWLAEMQLYQLNRVGQKHREVFGRLAGICRGARKPARVDIRVEGDLNASAFLVAGTQLTTIEGNPLIFETDTDLFLTRSKLLRVIADDGATQLDQMQANEKPGIAFLAFGESAGEGAMLNLGFDAFYPVEEPELSITIHVFNDDLFERCSADDPLAQVEDTAERTSPVDLVWEYRGAGNKWLPLELIDDQTRTFLQSGAITLAVPRNAAEQNKLFWIRARIVKGYFDVEPRLRSITLNTLPCSQKETVRNEPPLQGDGRPDQSFVLTKGPLLFARRKSRFKVTSSDVADWVFLANELDKSSPEAATELRDLLKTSRTDPSSDHNRIKRLNLELAGRLSHPRPVQQSAGVETGDDELASLLGNVPVVVTVADEPWQLVASLESSSPESKHFQFDPDHRIVKFGNGLNGKVPAAGQQIRAVWYRVSNGVSGNVGKDLNWKFVSGGIAGVSLTNPEPGKGGEDPEPLNEMELRAQAELARPQRAVTLRDFERIALSTPNAFVARAKAITNCPAPESITVVAVPKVRPGRKGSPKAPSTFFQTNVAQHLQKSRLLCDRVTVTPPIYIEVQVTAHLRLVTGAGAAAVTERARKALDLFLGGELQPADQNPTANNDQTLSSCPSRWPFGRSVFPSEVYAILDGVAGVDFASNLVLTANRNGVAIPADKSGAIPVPKVGLVYPGSHNLTVELSSRRNG